MSADVCEGCEFVYGVGHVTGPCKHKLALTTEEIDGIRAMNAALPTWPWAEAGAAETYAEQTRRDIPRMLATLDAREAELRKVTAQRDHLKRREQSIIVATEPADGGQYRADIVSAIQRLRQERDEFRAEVLRITAELGQE